MTQEIRLNGNGIPRIHLKPTNDIEKLALDFLQGAAANGQTVVLSSEDEAVVLTVREGK